MEQSRIASPERALLLYCLSSSTMQVGLVHVMVVEFYTSWLSRLRTGSVPSTIFYWLKQVTRPNQTDQVGIPSFYENYHKITLYRVCIQGAMNNGRLFLYFI